MALSVSRQVWASAVNGFVSPCTKRRRIKISQAKIVAASCTIVGGFTNGTTYVAQSNPSTRELADTIAEVSVA
jgi:hypothetical protein